MMAIMAPGGGPVPPSRFGSAPAPCARLGQTPGQGGRAVAVRRSVSRPVAWRAPFPNTAPMRLTPVPEPVAKGRAAASDVVRALPIARDDVALVEGLRRGEAWARAALFDRYAPQVDRILRRILGHERHVDPADLVHDAFVQALGSLDRLRDPAALLGFMQTIAARTAYRAIRARRARRWLFFWEPNEVPEVPVEDVDPDVLEAHRRTYALLEGLPADERVAFALRHIDGMELT